MKSDSVCILYAVVVVIGCMKRVSSLNSPPTIRIPNKYFPVSEATSIGATIYSLKASDPDGDTLIFTLTSPSGIVKVSSAVEIEIGMWRSNLTLNEYLNRDNGVSTINLYFTVDDGHQNVVPIKLVIVVTDVNDNPPILTGLPYQLSVNEDQPLGTSMYRFHSSDPDDGNGGVAHYGMKASVETDEEDYKSLFKLDPSTGIVTLVRSLDYEKRSFYHFKVSVEDEGSPPCPGPQCLCRSDEWTGTKKDYCNGSVADFFITIKDVEDTPPIFERVPYVGTVLEDKPIDHIIMRVKATAGDRGVAVSRKIRYSLSYATVPFYINQNGEIMVGRTLDADDEGLRKKGGLYRFNVTATEVGSPPPNETSTLVSITVQDVNDNKPEFYSYNFIASVFENTPQGVPLTMTSSIEIRDKDQGINSRFRIFVEKIDGNPMTSFSTIPHQGQILHGSSNVTIVVNNSTLLDFEQIKSITFKLIAKEVIGIGNDVRLGYRSSEAGVIVIIKDTNDNSPVFDHQITTFKIPKDSSIGDVIHTFIATDSDSGQFGQVTFSLAENSRFSVTSDGKLTLKSSLDRETRSSYFLVIIARDNPTAPESQRRESQLQVQVIKD